MSARRLPMVPLPILVAQAMRRTGIGVRELGRKATVDPAQISRFLARGEGLSVASLERVLGALPIQISLRPS